MLLTLPTSLDSLMPTTEQFESTQVEVSLDGKGMYSILVLSEEADVQCVVAVPIRSSRWNRCPRNNQSQLLSDNAFSTKSYRSNTHSHTSGNSYEDELGFNLSVTPSSTPSSRKADWMRPMSPIKENRNSCFEDRSRRQLPRRRGETQSLPPFSRKQAMDLDVMAEAPWKPSALHEPRSRSLSLLRRRESSTPLATLPENHVWQDALSTRNGRSGKPDMVHKMATRKNTLLSSMRRRDRINPAIHV